MINTIPTTNTREPKNPIQKRRIQSIDRRVTQFVQARYCLLSLSCHLLWIGSLGHSLAVEPNSVPSTPPGSSAAWATPAELRSKKMIDTGMHSLQGGTDPEYLASHPEFLEYHPFDGLTVLAPLDPQWCRTKGLPPRTVLDELAWAATPVPFEALQASATFSMSSVTDAR